MVRRRPDVPNSALTTVLGVLATAYARALARPSVIRN